MSSLDPNAYVFPNYHDADYRSPLLYNLIVTQFGIPQIIIMNDHNPNHNNNNNNNSIDNEEHHLLRKRQFIAKRIQTRCQHHPEEIQWVDTCGENALFRLCQLVRFGTTTTATAAAANNNNNNNTMTMIKYMRKKIKTKTSYINNNHNNNNIIPPNIVQSTNDLIFFVGHCILDKYNSNALNNTLNKWGETPLHQFTSHCGFLDTTTTTTTGSSKEYYCNGKNCMTKNNNMNNSNNNDDDGGLSILFLEMLLQACPEAIYQKNYQNEIPLHLACSLSQLNIDQPFTSSDSTISMDKFFQLTQLSSSICCSIYSNNNSEQHLHIVRRLIEYFPKGILSVDLNGCMPLFRAVDSIHCQADVVLLLLMEMESLFVNQSRRDYQSKSELYGVTNLQQFTDIHTTFLLRKAIFGYDGKDEVNMQHHDTINRKRVLSPLMALWETLFARRYIKQSVPFLLNKNSSSTCIADIILEILGNHNVISKDERAQKFSKSLGSFWEKIIMLICCAFHGTAKVISHGVDAERNKNILPVHAAVFCAAPLSVLKLLIRQYPNDLLKKDKNGNTPLMLSITSPTFAEQWNLGGSDHHHNNKDSIFKYLLRICPLSATIGNHSNRLPLHLAIEKNLPWNNGLNDLFHTYPEALSTRDPKNNILPFMLSSSCSISSSTSMESLTSTYMLLRADPTVLQDFGSMMK